MGRHQQDDSIEGITLICPVSSNNLTAIHRQSTFVRALSFREEIVKPQYSLTLRRAF